MMNSANGSAKRSALAAGVMVLLVAGCQSQAWRQFYQPPPPQPLGALSDPIWQNQEANAEMSDFVVYQHEFQKDTEWLNTNGEDHVKQIAARLMEGQDAQVVVERSNTSVRAETEFQYPVHPNPELDLRRREILVRSLAAMGIADAEARVVVAPALAQGITGNEAEAAYGAGLSGSDYGAGGTGGGFGGFMFGGGF